MVMVVPAGEVSVMSKSAELVCVMKVVISTSSRLVPIPVTLMVVVTVAASAMAKAGEAENVPLEAVVPDGAAGATAQTGIAKTRIKNRLTNLALDMILPSTSFL
jgi:hypothetical protein